MAIQYFAVTFIIIMTLLSTVINHYYYLQE